MNFKQIVISTSLVAIALFTINASYKGEPKDGLDKRIYIVNMTEVKENSPSKKAVQDEIEFKADKGMFSNYLFEKMQLKWLKYDILKDSTYTDEDNNEARWIQAEVIHTDESDQTTLMTLTVENFEIKGEIKVTKKDKLKKKYEFSGKEKEKKKK